MKNILVLIAMSTVIVSCTKSIEIKEEYKILEALFDPGDGSGVFQPTASEMVVTIFEDNTYETRKGSMCSITNSEEVDSGVFDFAANTLTTTSCSTNEFLLNFTLESDTLLVSLPCIEPCTLKFVRLK